jgi:hypothetical protein
MTLKLFLPLTDTCKVEGFFKVISSYFPKSSIPDDNVPEAQTPTGATAPPTFLPRNKLGSRDLETLTPQMALPFCLY